jgi:hypothetical protein
MENALLRQQLAVLERQAKRPRYTWRDRWLLVFLASNPTPWGAGIVSCSSTFGHTSQNARVAIMRQPQRLLLSSSEWRRRTNCGARSDCGVSCASWVGGWARTPLLGASALGILVNANFYIRGECKASAKRFNALDLQSFCASSAPASEVGHLASSASSMLRLAT